MKQNFRYRSVAVGVFSAFALIGVAAPAAEIYLYSCKASFPEEVGQTMKDKDHEFEMTITDNKVDSKAGVRTNVGSISPSVDKKAKTVAIDVQASTGDGSATMYSTTYPLGTPIISTRFEVINLRSDKRAEGKLDCVKKD